MGCQLGQSLKGTLIPEIPKFSLFAPGRIDTIVTPPYTFGTLHVISKSHGVKPLV